MKIQLIDKLCMPTKKHKTDAGWDLKNREEIKLGYNRVQSVPLGIATEIPEGYVGLIFPRSGLGSKGLVLANTVGVIDSDYRGEYVAAIKNSGGQNSILRIPKYERICQLVIVPIKLEELDVVDELTDTVRGSGGFGSTGNA